MPSDTNNCRPIWKSQVILKCFSALGSCWAQRTHDAVNYQYFLAYFDKICEVQLVIYKLQAHNIERTNRKLKMENETNSSKMRGINYFVSLSSRKISYSAFSPTWAAQRKVTVCQRKQKTVKETQSKFMNVFIVGAMNSDRGNKER